MKTINKRVVEAAKPPASGQVFIRDSRLPGFALRVTAAGTKSFVLESRIHGRTRRFTLGRFPAMSAARAYELALKAKGNIAEGNDPLAERDAARGELTVGDLGEMFMERHSKPHKRSWREDQRIMALHRFECTSS